MAKGEFSKFKGSICNIPMEAASVYNVSTRPAVSNGLNVFKLKQDFNCELLILCNIFNV